MSKDTESVGSVKQGDLDAAMRHVLLALKPSGQKSGNREPSKKELKVRYRLERRR